MKRRILSVLILAMLSLSFVLPADIPFIPDMSVTAQAAAVSAPKASVKSGTYAISNSSMSVKLSCSDKKATIYYSVNGAGYKKYSSSSPVKISRNSTLKIYSKTSSGKSKTVSYSYKLKPKLTVDSIEATDGIKLIFTAKPSGCTVYYTTDGSKPTTSSPKYSSSYITVKKSCKVRMLIKKKNWTAAYSYYDVNIAGSSSDGIESYTSPKTGSKFDMPKLGYAETIFDNSANTVPVSYITNNATTSSPNDRFLAIYLEGSKSGNYVAFTKITNSGWKTGAEYTLDNFGISGNYIYINGLYRYYLQYLGTYTSGVNSYQNSSYFDDAYFNVISLDSDGKYLTFYFYVKSHDSSATHVMEGVGYAELDANKSSSSTGSSTGGSTSTVTPTPSVPSTGGKQMCAVCHGSSVCSVCNGSGYTWGWKQKVRCFTCSGSGRCSYCVGGYVYY